MNRISMLIVFVWLIIIMSGVWITYGNLYPRQHSRFIEHQDGPELAKLKKLMQKHGVSSAECEGSDCYFIRDGERCALK